MQSDLFDNPEFLDKLNYEIAYGNSFNSVNSWEMPECKNVEQFGGDDWNPEFAYYLDAVQKLVEYKSENETLDSKALEEDWEEYNNCFNPEGYRPVGWLGWNIGTFVPPEYEAEFGIIDSKLEILVPLLYDLLGMNSAIPVKYEVNINTREEFSLKPETSRNNKSISGKNWRLTGFDDKKGPYIIGEDIEEEIEVVLRV